MAGTIRVCRCPARPTCSPSGAAVPSSPAPAAASTARSLWPWREREPDTASIPDLVKGVSRRIDGVLDVVVHAAGVQARGLATELTDADLEHVLTVNLTAPWRLSTEVARGQMASGAGGSHVRLASMLVVTSCSGSSSGASRPCSGCRWAGSAGRRTWSAPPSCWPPTPAASAPGSC